MANWCSNSVVFTAEPEKLQAIYDLFAGIQQKQEADGRYHLPDFATTEDGCMSDIFFDGGRICYESRWTPNIELLMEIADFYQATFRCKYQQMSAGIYGETRYDERSLVMLNLDEEDFKAVRYDKIKKGYPINGEVFEFEGDLLDYILEQKMGQKYDVQHFPRER